MGSAVGQYVTEATAEQRLVQAGTSLDAPTRALVATICTQVNSFIETKTGRAICPVPPYASTFTGSGDAGTVASATGLEVGDHLLIGLISGVHEEAAVLYITPTQIPASAWVANTVYATGNLVVPTVLNGHSYQVVSEAGTSDLTTEPTWPTDGTAIVDGTLVWLDVGLTAGTAAWVAGSGYLTGDLVTPTTPNGHLYQVVSEAGTSDVTEPVWPVDGTAIVDNDLIWRDVGATVGPTVITLDITLEHTYTNAPCQRIYVENGLDALDTGRTLLVPRGIFAMAAMEVTTYTRGPFSLVPQTDYFLQPSVYERLPGWPATEIRMTNIPSTANPVPVFFPAYRSVRLIGPGPCVGQTSASGFGWAVMPDDIQDIGLKLFMATFRERASSGGETYTLNLDGTRTYERALSYEDKLVLSRYSIKTVTLVEAGMIG